MKEILLVEPNKLFAQTCQKALVASGYNVSLAASAQSAIASADEKKPDLVILELQLAKHNGIEFLYEFRSYADWQKVPIIIYSQIPPSRFSTMQKELALLGVSQYFDKSKTSLAKLTQAVASEIKNEPASH